MSSSEDTHKKLQWLEILMENLPDQLSTPPLEKSQYKQFKSFVIDPDLIERTGDEQGGFNETMKSIFGWQARTTGDGIIAILERGPAICAAVDVMREAHRKWPDNTIVGKWVEDIVLGAEKAYRIAGKALPTKPAESRPVVAATSVTSILRAKRTADEAMLEEGVVAPKYSKVTMSWEEVVAKVKGKGRRNDETITALAIRYRQRQSPKASYWACMGLRQFVGAEPCSHIVAGNADRSRILAHAKSCEKLPSDLKRLATDQAADSALGNKVNGGMGQVLTPVRDGSGNVSAQATGSNRKVSPSSSAPSLKKQSTLDHDFTKAGQSDVQNEIDFRILKLICVRGLVPSILNTPEWKDLIEYCTRNGPNRSYKPTSAETFTKTLIPNEASLVRKRTLEALKNERNLTVTFDGNSIRKPQSVYTSHIITKDRCVYFWDGHEGSREHHDAQYVKKFIGKTVNAIGGPAKCAGVCSDSTGNTRKGRKDYVEDNPTVFDLGDTIHGLHNTVGEISKIPEFTSMLSQNSKNVAYIRKSNITNVTLRDDAFGETGREHFVVGISRTRFATHWSSVSSMEPHLRPLQRLIENGDIKNQAVRDFFLDKKRVNEFEIVMHQYIDIIGPLARSLWSLESTKANASDVYVFWLAIGSSLKDLFINSKARLSLDDSLIQSVTRIFNRRWKAFIDEAPTDIYFTAFYLDPRYSQSAILKKPTGMSFTISVPAARVRDSDENDLYVDIVHPAAFKRAKEFLKKVLAAEVDRLDEGLGGSPEDSLLFPLYLKYNSRKDDLVEAFRSQLFAYGKNQYPFRAGRSSTVDSLKWWERLVLDDNADVLATLAVKIFSVLVNSMPDERTGSNITWFNSPLRGNQTVDTLVNMIQVGQWYKTHAPRVAGEVLPECRRPVVKFRDMVKELASTHSQDSQAEAGDEVDIDDDSESDDNANEEGSWALAVDSYSSFDDCESTELLMDKDINLNAPELRDLLAVSDPTAGKAGLNGTTTKTIGSKHAAAFQTAPKRPDVPNYDF